MKETRNRKTRRSTSVARSQFRPVEPLEPRRLFSADIFTGTGSWTDATHWSLNAIPGTGDTATISAGATVNVAAAEPAAGIINMGTIDLTTDAATFGIGSFASITNTGTIAKTGGTGISVIIAGVDGGTVIDNGGTLSAATGTLSIASAAQLNGTHFLTAAGTAISFDQVSTATVNGFANQTNISGTLTATGSGSILFNSGSMYNEHQTSGDSIATGTLDFPAGMAEVTGFGLEIYGSDAQLVNAGELDYVGSAAHADINIDNTGTIVNKGTTDLVNGDQTGFINDTTGTINLTTDAGIGYLANGHGGNLSVTNKGLIEKTAGTGVSSIGTGGGINFDNEGGQFIVNSGTLLLEGSDTLAGGAGIDTAAGTTFEVDLDNTASTLTGQTMEVAGTITGTGTGTVLFNSGAMYNEHQTTGDSIATATLNFPAGMAQVTGMSFEVYGSGAQVVNAGELDYVGASTHGETNLENAGKIINEGTADIVDGNQTGFLNDASGVIDLTTDAGLSYLANGHGGDLRFTNKGLIEKTGGTGTSKLDIPTTNAGGQFIVNSGTLSWTNSGEVADWTFGGLTIASGSSFIVDPNHDIHMSGTFTATGGGSVQFGAGSMYGPDSGAGQDTTVIGDLAFNPGTFQLAGGEFRDETGLENTGEVDISGTNLLSFLDNKGTVLVTDAGPITSVDGFLNDTGGLLNFQADTVVTDGYHANITNNGTILKSGGTGTLDLSNNSLSNNGKIECSSGTIKLGNYGSTLPAGQTFQADTGGTIITADNAITDVEGTAILGGAGASIPAIAGLTTVGGTFEVLSGASFTTTGSLAVSGNLTVGGDVAVTGALSTGTVLSFPIVTAPGTAGAPSLTVAGATTLAGELQVTVPSTLTIPANSVYTVATFASAASGSFSSTNATDFSAKVNPTTIVLDSSGSNVTPVQGGTLVPTVIRSTVPATVVGTVRHAGNVFVHVTSTATTTNFTKDITLYATTTGTVDSASLVLHTIARKMRIKPGQTTPFTLPVQTQNLPAGTYTLLVETIDSTGLATIAVAGPTLVVQPPVVTLSATVGKVTPAVTRIGRRASVVLTLANTGNIDSTALLTFQIGLSTDGSATATVNLTPIARRIRVSDNKRPVKVVLPFTLPSSLDSIAYYPVITVSTTATVPATNTVTSVGGPFTPLAVK